MDKRGELARLRGKHGSCKRAARRAALGCLLLLAAPGCRSHVRTIALHTLEDAPAVELVAQQRRVASDPEVLRKLCIPISPRLAVVIVRSPEALHRLAQAVPGVALRPDFGRGGAVIGLVSWSGTPLDGQWPIVLEEIRVHQGAALLRASFAPGSYLPDGSGWLELAEVEGVRSLLAVEVNGTLFYPE